MLLLVGTTLCISELLLIANIDNASTWTFSTREIYFISNVSKDGKKIHNLFELVAFRTDWSHSSSGACLSRVSIPKEAPSGGAL